jgi:hypothetical protein
MGQRDMEPYAEEEGEARYSIYVVIRDRYPNDLHKRAIEHEHEQASDVVYCA